MVQLPEGACLDLVLAHLGHELLPVQSVLRAVNLQRIHPVIVCSVIRTFGEVEAGNGIDFALVRGIVLPFQVQILGELLELSHADGGLNIRQPVVVADVIVNKPDLVILGLGGEIFRPIGVLAAVGKDHASAAGGDDLVAIERQAPNVANAARVPALELAGGVLRADTFRSVFDDLDVPLPA